MCLPNQPFFSLITFWNNFFPFTLLLYPTGFDIASTKWISTVSTFIRHTRTLHFKAKTLRRPFIRLFPSNIKIFGSNSTTASFTRMFDFFPFPHNIYLHLSLQLLTRTLAQTFTTSILAIPRFTTTFRHGSLKGSFKR